MKELDQGYEFTKAQLAELEQLRQRVKELEHGHLTRDARLIERHDATCREVKRVTDKLAASQLENKRLREVLIVMCHPVMVSHAGPARYREFEDAVNKQPTDTEALEQYLADRLGEPVAWGNFKDNGEACMLSISQHPEDRANWMNPKPLYALKERP